MLPNVSAAVAVIGLTVAGGNEQLVVSWNSTSDPVASRYRVSVTQTGSTTVVKSEDVPLRGGGRVSHTVTGLLNFTSYEVTVSVVCANGGDGNGTREVGTTRATGKCVCVCVCVCVCGSLHHLSLFPPPLSPFHSPPLAVSSPPPLRPPPLLPPPSPLSSSLPPPPPAPTAIVSGFVYELLMETSDLVVVNLSWTALPEHQWNGIPLGYRVFIFSHADETQMVFDVPYPATYVVVSVSPGLYMVHIAAMNNVNISQNFLKERDLLFSEIEPSGTFADYPYFYILIPGVIFLVIIVVIIIVIVKKLHEGKKRSITFVRGKSCVCVCMGRMGATDIKIMPNMAVVLSGHSAT